MISFEEVSQSYRASKIFVELAGIQRSLASLFIPPTLAMPGMYDPAKTATVDYTPVKVVSADDVASKAGFGSHAHRQALRLPSSIFSQGGGVWWFPIPEEGAGVLATEDITITGAATSSGTLYFSIAGDVFSVGVASGDAVGDIATAIADKITAEIKLPVDGAATLGVVQVDAKFKGTAGNQILIKFNPSGEAQENQNPAGVTVTLSEVGGYLALGATDPDMEDMFFDSSGNDILGDRWYTHMTMPFTDATNLIHYKESTTQRADAGVNRFYFAIAGYNTETYAQALALPATFNSKYLVQIWEDRIEYPAFEFSANLAGIAVDEEGQSPNRPIKTIALDGPADTTVVNRRDTENNALFKAGMSYCKIDTSGVLRLGDIALTYRTNDAGGATEEWFDLVQGQGRQAKAYSIEQLFLAEKYTRGVVADNDQPTALTYVIKPKTVIADLTKLVLDLWAAFGWSKNIADILESIKAEINAGNNGRIDSELIDDEARALRILAIRFAFLY